MNSVIEKEQFLTLQELVVEARSKLADNAWAYIVGGAETETSLRRNRLALDSLALRPRVLNDVSEIDTAAELFGSPSRLPVFLCPVVVSNRLILMVLWRWRRGPLRLAYL